MSKSQLLAISMLAIALMSGIGLTGFSDEHEDAKQQTGLTEIPILSGKIVLLQVDKSTTLESKSESIVIKDPKIISIGGRYFIHGKPHLMKESEEWFSDGAIGVAWDSVKSYWVFTPESYEKYEDYRKNATRD